MPALSVLTNEAFTSSNSITFSLGKYSDDKILIRQGKFCGKKFSGKVLGLFLITAMVCEKHTVAVFFFYLWSLIIFPNYVENVNFAAFFRRMRKKKIKKIIFE